MLLAECSNIQGNDVKSRAHVMAKDGQRTWLDPHILSSGILTKFYVYIGYINTSSSSAQIRLQIWRPFSNNESTTHLLIWEIRVTVDLTNLNGALYVVIRIFYEADFIALYMQINVTPLTYD